MEIACAVIKFKDSKEVSVAPINWLRGCKCLWPPRGSMFKIASLIEKGIAVTPSETWESFSIEFIGIYATYKEARLKADEDSECQVEVEVVENSECQVGVEAVENSQYLWNTTDTEDCGRGKRKKKKRKLSLSSTESAIIVSDDERIQDVKPPIIHDLKYVFTSTEKDIARTNNVSESSLYNADLIPVYEQASSSNKESSLSVNGAQVPETSPLSNKAFQRFLVREIQIIRSNQNAIMDSLNDLLKTMSSANSVSVYSTDCSLIKDILQLLPIRTDTNLNIIEERLQDENSSIQMVSYLSRLGGAHVEQGIKFMLRRLLSDEIAMTFSLLGKQGKQAFQSTNICKIIIRTVQNHPSWNSTGEKDIERVVSNWLRHAKGRIHHKKLKIINNLIE